MSTMEIVCARCDKKFRVRAEFAGRSTRCPGCSAPITIGSAPRAAVPEPRRSEVERAKPRPKPKDDDDAPRRKTLNWVSTDRAFRREQVAVIFALLSILGAFLTFCLGQLARLPGMGDEPILILIALLFGAGPSLATAAFGLIARVTALGVPSETLARGSSISSLLCAIAGLLALVVLALSILMSIDSQRHDELPKIVATGALVLSGLAALFSFVGFTAQVGIYQRSPAVSRAVARMGIAATICVLTLLGIGVLYTLFSEFATPRYGYTDQYGRGGYIYHPDHSGFFVATGLLMPISLGVVLILYHRLLAAGRRAIDGEPATDLQD